VEAPRTDPNAREGGSRDRGVARGAEDERREAEAAHHTLCVRGESKNTSRCDFLRLLPQKARRGEPRSCGTRRAAGVRPGRERARRLQQKRHAGARVWQLDTLNIFLGLGLPLLLSGAAHGCPDDTARAKGSVKNNLR
jgi:hypothetical protein